MHPDARCQAPHGEECGQQAPRAGAGYRSMNLVYAIRFTEQPSFGPRRTVSPFQSPPRGGTVSSYDAFRVGELRTSDPFL